MEFNISSNNSKGNSTMPENNDNNQLHMQYTLKYNLVDVVCQMTV